MKNDPFDTRPLVDQIGRIWRETSDDSPVNEPFFQGWANTMPDADVGTLLMLGAILCLAIGFSLIFIKGEGNKDIIFSRKSWEITFPEWSWIFALVYYFGLLMTIRETQIFGLQEYFKYLIAVTAVGLVSAIVLGLLCTPFLRLSIRLYDSVMRFKEAVLMVLVQEYGFPQNSKEIMMLFAKKRMLRLYGNVRTFAMPLITQLGALAKMAIKKVVRSSAQGR